MEILLQRKLFLCLLLVQLVNVVISDQHTKMMVMILHFVLKDFFTKSGEGMKRGMYN
jgi:hypothetical protein